ncbi:hypothetical protein Psuf_068440 [Phytohabitans suffuscus]|uniref:Metallo-beta-lactamase domain-containing protein n=1 Tax=Phytohabitans suffuscus TaxID=624315 RepID=A0A6F8YUL5_9ACTN|nr:hypothetical protein Psuf_068440 [Phytohabitans suffuscus]
MHPDPRNVLSASSLLDSGGPVAPFPERHVPELRRGLDAGLVEGRQVETVLLTHGHLDHAKDLDFLAAWEAGVDIFLPTDLMPYVVDHLRAGTRYGTSRGR